MRSDFNFRSFFEKKYINRDFGKICYIKIEKKSNLPTLLMIHGFAGDKYTWQYCLVDLSNYFKVVCIDLPSHGDSCDDIGDGSLVSMSKRLEVIIEALNIINCHCVAHSMGGEIAIYLAKMKPNIFLSFTLLAPAGFGNLKRTRYLRDFINFKNYKNVNILVELMLGNYANQFKDLLNKSILKISNNDLRKKNYNILIDQAILYDDLHPEGSSFFWNYIKKPFHIVWGRDDKISPVPDLKYLPDLNNFTIIENVSHLPHIESPKEVVKLIRIVCNV
jgi:pyruvate dehydrogenase E2 component (dihydrolipoamide acetyltransferase)